MALPVWDYYHTALILDQDIRQQEQKLKQTKVHSAPHARRAIKQSRRVLIEMLCTFLDEDGHNQPMEPFELEEGETIESSALAGRPQPIDKSVRVAFDRARTAHWLAEEMIKAKASQTAIYWAEKELKRLETSVLSDHQYFSLYSSPLKWIVLTASTVYNADGNYVWDDLPAEKLPKDW